MTESIPDRYALCRIKGKEFLNQVQKLPVDNIGWWNNILEKVLVG